MTRLSPPGENLRVSVVVPARNEEDLIQACLEALAAQESIASDEYEVILVLDDCKDETELRAREVSLAHPDLRIHFVDGPGKGAGHARRVGMDTACKRLLDLGKPSGLIASTDADTVVAPNWLSTQLAHASRGAKAIGGRIELNEEESLPENVVHWRRDQGQTRHQNLLAENGEASNNVMEHWQFSGASLALTASVYEEIGGLEPLTALEDEYLERVLRQRGISIERPLAVKVRTSARRNGRAERGLAQDLALAYWFQSNTYKTPCFDVNSLLQTKRASVSLVLPGERYSSRFLHEVSGLQEVGLLDEVLVVDQVSEAGWLPRPIEAYRAEELMSLFGPVRGYGDLLWRGLSVARGDIVATLDHLREEAVVERLCGLLGPLMERDDLSFVKGFQSSPSPLSDLVARPVINLYHPTLSGFVDPLSRDFAGRRQLLRQMPFPVGSGVDISLLLDAAERVGIDALSQSYGGASGDPASGDGEASYAIIAAVARRISDMSSEGPIPGPFFLPGPEKLDALRVPVEERPALESLAAVDPL